ncbi:unnamed protein product [Brassicogethes aeneus]|uniref:Uncharacterized protein n=1 Tax=Brassicogethes aeneus TaxID=1431903 RepID=A0A9P0FGZ8_BRAAE|nr:unnamed protein product [Brassicogethes aeneus]
MEHKEKESIRDFYLEEIRDVESTIQMKALKSTTNVAVTLGEHITRQDLLPALEEISRTTTDEEVMICLAEQIKNLAGHVGGLDHTIFLVKILWNLTSNDEKLVRIALIDAIKEITKEYTIDMNKEVFLPLLLELTNKEWAFSKRTAFELIANTYLNFDEDSRLVLREILKTGLTDDSPIIRKSSVESIEEVINKEKPNIILRDLIECLNVVSVDDMDTVRIYTIPLCIAIGNKLNKEEYLKYIQPVLETIKDDASWKIHHMMSLKIPHLLNSSEGEDHLNYTQNIMFSLLAHSELEVQVAAVENLFLFYQTAKQHCERCDKDFDKCFQDEIVRVVIELIGSPSSDIRVALSEIIISFGGILSKDTFQNSILPNIVDWMLAEDKMTVQENILLNLNKIPQTVDVSLLSGSIKEIILNLFGKSNLHWRCRLNILLVLTYFTKFMTKEEFDENLKLFLSTLINDKIFAVRRTTPLLLPILSKTYGIKWVSEKIVPNFMMFTTDTRYRFNYLPLYCINELIHPTLQRSIEKYLNEYKEKIESPAVLKSLYKISKLFNKIKVKLEEDHLQKALTLEVPKYLLGCDMQLYAEGTFTTLKENYSGNFYAIDENDCQYLEGILLLIHRDFLDSILHLCESNVENIKIYTKHTLKNIKKFLEKLNTEFNQPWIKEALNKIPVDEAAKFQEEIEEILSKKIDYDDVVLNLVDVSAELPNLGHTPSLQINNEGLTKFSTEFNLVKKIENSIDDNEVEGKSFSDDVLDELNSIIAKEEGKDKAAEQKITNEVKEDSDIMLDTNVCKEDTNNNI